MEPLGNAMEEHGAKFKAQFSALSGTDQYVMKLSRLAWLEA